MKSNAIKIGLLLAGSAGLILLSPKSRDYIRNMTKNINDNVNNIKCDILKSKIQPEKINFC